MRNEVDPCPIEQLANSMAEQEKQLEALRKSLGAQRVAINRLERLDEYIKDGDLDVLISKIKKLEGSEVDPCPVENQNPVAIFVLNDGETWAPAEQCHIVAITPEEFERLEEGEELRSILREGWTARRSP